MCASIYRSIIGPNMFGEAEVHASLIFFASKRSCEMLFGPYAEASISISINSYENTIRGLPDL